MSFHMSENSINSSATTNVAANHDCYTTAAQQPQNEDQKLLASFGVADCLATMGLSSQSSRIIITCK